MTESERLTATHPGSMLDFLFGPANMVRGTTKGHDWEGLSYPQARASDRKLRLFAVACCHRLRPLLQDVRSLRAVAVAAWLADGTAEPDEVERAREGAHDVELWVEDDVPTRAAMAACYTLEPAARAAARGCAYWAGMGSDGVEDPAVREEQAILLRDVIGDPFAPVVFVSEWKTENVVGLAQGIYDDHAFDRVPVLADALDDAGCADPDILDHCRGSGHHARGCWVVDAVLGKE